MNKYPLTPTRAPYRWGLIMLLLSATLFATSCKKDCRCYRYDAKIVEYSHDDVEKMANGSCSEMKYQTGLQYYSYCEWALFD